MQFCHDVMSISMCTGVFSLYCAPWARPQENMALGALPETLEAMTGQQKALLGLRAWHAVRVSPRSR